MKRNWLIYNNIWSVKGGTGWYLLVLGQSNLVLGQNNLVPIGIKWYWVSLRLLCLYILKKSGDFVGCYWDGQTNGEQGKIELVSQWTMEG